MPKTVHGYGDDLGSQWHRFGRAHRPDLDGELDDRQIGGLGIHLVRSISSTFSYALEDEINVVRLHIERASQG